MKKASRHGSPLVPYLLIRSRCGPDHGLFGGILPDFVRILNQLAETVGEEGPDPGCQASDDNNQDPAQYRRYFGITAVDGDPAFAAAGHEDHSGKNRKDDSDPAEDLRKGFDFHLLIFDFPPLFLCFFLDSMILLFDYFLVS